jgi:hypothetical protein
MQVFNGRVTAPLRVRQRGLNGFPGLDGQTFEIHVLSCVEFADTTGQAAFLFDLPF